MFVSVFVLVICWFVNSPTLKNKTCSPPPLSQLSKKHPKFFRRSTARSRLFAPLVGLEQKTPQIFRSINCPLQTVRSVVLLTIGRTRVRVIQTGQKKNEKLGLKPSFFVFFLARVRAATAQLSPNIAQHSILYLSLTAMMKKKNIFLVYYISIKIFFFFMKHS